MPLASGDDFAGYHILRLLGTGGMGEVYLARHPSLPKRVALKVLPAELSSHGDFRARFNQEADLAAALYHPSIVGIHDRGEFQGQLWISMDYIDGTDAGWLLRHRYPIGMPRAEVLGIVSSVADALDYIHDRGLLHRDVKPSNILLTEAAPERRRALLADFGIARNASDVSGLTQTNMVIGTVGYAAPEQLMGRPLDGRADQYALAATAYHLLTGSLLYEHPNNAVVISHHLSAPPPALADTHPQLASLDPVLATALSKNREDRFPTCTDFAHALAGERAKSDAPQWFPLPPAPLSVPPTPLISGTAGSRPVSQPSATMSAHETGSAIDRKARSAIAAAVTMITLVAVAAVLVAVKPWKHDSAPKGSSDSSSSLDFNAMRDFVTGYYSDLPANPEAAWAKTSNHFRTQTPHEEFVDFWAQIDAVTLDSVSPRDATSVVARLNFVRHDGQSDTEDRWLKMVTIDGQIALDESERIGSVDESSASPTTAPVNAFNYQPLWPFASQSEADRWLTDEAPKGSSSWHADAEATARLFTQTFLGFTEITQAVMVETENDDAWVDVGYSLPDGRPTTVATIHLVRFGTDPSAPWEVVGTRDDRLTLETPPYGSTVVGSVIEAGGTITGVDECINLQVRQGNPPKLLGKFSCLMTGGQASPWSAQVPVTGAQSGALTLVAYTGGHAAEVEAFAITGIRAK